MLALNYEGTSIINIGVVGIDIAKSVFQGCMLLHAHHYGSLRIIASLSSTNAEVWVRGHVNSCLIR